jgi:hypothetical protein
LKNGFIEVISKWILSKDKGDIESLDKAFHHDSESSDLEEFKIGIPQPGLFRLGSGGAATTSFHMARKNSNAKISDLINSENTQNHREILNVLTHLLSINVYKEESLLTQSEMEIKKIFADENNQLQLGKICFTFINKFANTEDSIQGKVRRRIHFNRVLEII